MSHCRHCGCRTGQADRFCGSCGAALSPNRPRSSGRKYGLGLLAIAGSVAFAGWALQDAGWPRARAGTIPVTTPTTPILVASVSPVPSTPVPPLNVTAGELSREFGENEIRAGQHYGAAVAEVTGVVRDVGRDPDGTMYVDLGDRDPWKLRAVHCRFDRGGVGQVSPLNKGETVTIRGRINGVQFNVLVWDCSVVQSR